MKIETIIAGALFDLLGYLTTREERTILSARDDASPAVAVLGQFAAKRNLSLDDADVSNWRTKMNEQVVTDTGLPALRDWLNVASLSGQQINLSPASAGALHYAMTTGAPPPELPPLTLASVLPLSQATDEEMSNFAHYHQGERIIRAAPAVANAAKTDELPPLPEPSPTHYQERGLSIERMEMYTADQMHAYARAAIAATAPNTAVMLTDEQIIEIATTTRSAEANKDGGYILPISFARAILAAAGTPP